MSKPKVSVIIPIYNVEKYLPECLDSILNQTFQEIEIICVNDATPDNSAQILEQYALQDSRIKIITHEKNGGLGAARNTGVAHAKSPYIAFVDSDDTIEPTFIEELYIAIVNNNADMSWCGIAKITEKGAFIDYKNIPEKSWSVQELLNCRSLHPSILPVWNKLFILDYFKNIEQLPIISEDLPAVAEYLTKCSKVVTVNKPLYNYRKRPGTLSAPDKQNPEHWNHFFYSNSLSLDILRKKFSRSTLFLQTKIRASSIFWRIETHQMYLSNSWKKQKTIKASHLNLCKLEDRLFQYIFSFYLSLYSFHFFSEA